MTINNKFDERMDFEINQRITNPDWDYTIAANVVSKHRKKVRKNIYTVSSLSLLATAAMILVAVFFTDPSGQLNDVETFISKQVNETHKAVFKDTYADSLLTVSYTEDSNSVDNLITTALLTR